MTDFRFGGLSIDAAAFGSQGSAILGIRDSGKTYTATLLAEKTFESGIPFIAFDPIGVWRFLRVPGKGRGYPVVVAGGQEGDLPLTVTGAPEIVRAAMSNGVSLVIDLFDINLSKADWKRIVTSCVRALLHENSRHGLRHIFIEEAAEFAPQRVGPDQGQVYAEIEKLARMGGNSRLGYTLINQRAEEVNKAVLELCDNLFLHRQKGRNSLTALSKWLDIGAVKDHKAIIDTLATLPTGECWAWLGGTERPVHVKVPAKNSLHPDRRVMRGDATVKRKDAVDVNSFVESMRSSLVAVEKETKANDPRALKAEIAALKKQMADAVRQRIVPDPAAVEEAERRGFERGVESIRHAVIPKVQALGDQFFAATDEVMKAKAAVREFVDEWRKPEYPGPSKRVPTPAPSPAPKSPSYAKPIPQTGDGSLTGPQNKIMRSLLFWASIGQAAPSREQVAAVAGYSPGSGGFNNLLGQLRSAGHIEYPASGVVAVNGTTALQPFMDRIEARDMMLGTLSAPQRKIIDALHVGRVLSREELAERSGYSAGSGGFNNLLGSLRTLKVIDYPATGQVVITEWAGELLA